MITSTSRKCSQYDPRLEYLGPRRHPPLGSTSGAYHRDDEFLMITSTSRKCSQYDPRLEYLGPRRHPPLGSTSGAYHQDGEFPSHDYINASGVLTSMAQDSSLQLRDDIYTLVARLKHTTKIVFPSQDKAKALSVLSRMPILPRFKKQ
jgi:hypothetical protein